MMLFGIGHVLERTLIVLIQMRIMNLKSSYGAFGYCVELKTISVDKNNSEFCTINGSLYSKDKSILYAIKSSEEFEVPMGTKLIKAFSLSNSNIVNGYKPFVLYYKMKKVILPETVEIIEAENYDDIGYYYFFRFVRDEKGHANNTILNNAKTIVFKGTTPPVIQGYGDYLLFNDSVFNDTGFTYSDIIYPKVVVPKQSIKKYLQLKYEGINVFDKTSIIENGVEKINISKDQIIIKVGKQSSIKAEAIAYDNTKAKLIWKSSNTNIATVSKNGIIKGLKKGSVVITCLSEDKKVTASCKVIVN